MLQILLKFAMFTSVINAAKRMFNSDKICRSYIVIWILASLFCNTMYLCIYNMCSLCNQRHGLYRNTM